MKHWISRALSALTACTLLLACFGPGHAAAADRAAAAAPQAEVSQAQAIQHPPAAYRATESIPLTDAQAKALRDLSARRGQSPRAAAAAASQVKVAWRDWSKYANPGATSKLTRAERTLYERMDSACLAYLKQPGNPTVSNGHSFIPTEIAFNDLGLTEDQMKAVVHWFVLCNPQYYFVGHTFYSDTTIYLGLYDFVLALDQPAVTNQMFDKLDSWIAECNKAGQTIWEKVCTLNKKISESTIYSPEVSAKGSEATTEESQTMYSLLMTPDTVCAGYSDVFYAMANAMGLDCYCVASEDHGWNVVRFEDGNYYIVDVTWNDVDGGYTYAFVGVGTDYMSQHDSDNQHKTSDDLKAFAPAVPKDSFTGFGHMALSTGAAYYGQWSNGAPNGYGRMAYTDGAVYEGMWGDGKRTVLGCIQLSDGTTYEGGWKEDQWDGQGILTLPSGDVFLGDWTAGKQNGSGTLLGLNGTVISGQWKGADIVTRTDGRAVTFDSGNTYYGELRNGKPGGFGRMYYKDGSVYQGCWVDGQWYGYGELTPADKKAIYHGYWKEGSKTIIGKYFWSGGGFYFGAVEGSVRQGWGVNCNSTGDIYVGNWKNDAVTGYGMNVWTDGDSYVGNNLDSKKSGYGVYNWFSGDTYAGAWKADAKNGWGRKYTLESGEYRGTWYAGFYKNNLRSGYGTYAWADGSVYEGEWFNDLPGGFGVQTSASGTKRPGLWQEGKYVEGTDSGFQTVQYKNGTYLGGLKDGNPQGYGRMEFTDGTVYAGTFKDGKLDGSGVFLWKPGNQSTCEAYLGKFQAGARTGHGFYTWTTGAYLECDWLQGNAEGTGTEVCADGSVVTGTWKAGEFVG